MGLLNGSTLLIMGQFILDLHMRVLNDAFHGFKGIQRTSRNLACLAGMSLYTYQRVRARDIFVFPLMKFRNIYHINPFYMGGFFHFNLILTVFLPLSF